MNWIGALAGRVAREPLTHFLVIGAVIFLSATGLKALRQPVLRIDADEINQLAAYWALQMQRPPTAEELRGIIHERVDEEILAREARSRGLDRDDIIIRRRLAQKMAFSSEDVTPVAEPDEATLKALYEKTAGQYVTPAHVALGQVYFSGNRGDAQARAAAEAALKRLQAGAADVAGDPFVLPLAYADALAPDLVRDYGEPYVAFLGTAPLGVWSGPVRSEYGWHLVKVVSRTQPVQPPFAEVRPQVREAYVVEQRRRANAVFMEGLRRKYRIEIAGGGGLAATLAPGDLPPN